SINKLMSDYNEDELLQSEIQLKYKGYIQTEEENVEKLLRHENLKIDSTFDFNTITSLSLEARDKLNQIKPENIGQASRISGVSPADVSVLLVHFGR
ncbi:tRNA uridine-5-carboxymethylaminomethyl(34) synthesis enzyme MnmG, partial [Bacteroidia bacterium]|nr:tRNA uridine-5-carboxymethylaminomethyl(34) synthesis enzyme MnmG [Bacteroidia bacterium]